MIYIYTKKGENDGWILKNDLFFNLYTSNQTLSDADKKAIEAIDTAKVTDGYHIETKYGLGTIRNLSSGCKTYLNILKNPDKVVSTEECGPNVLEKIFDMDNIHIYMSRPERFPMKDSVQLCFNEKDVVTGRTGYEHWWSKEYERREEDDLSNY